ncbi:MAG: nucleoside 2-deoxyribosyltransferase, partial [Fidelibacterota bacterium]
MKIHHPMRFYFSACITGGRDQAHIYPRIIEYPKQYGEVLTTFVADNAHTQLGEQQAPPESVYQRDIDYINQCDVLLTEVTIPSFGVGVEVAHAGIQGKPVLALCQPAEGRRLSTMIAGDPNVTVTEYRILE